ncbi:MAG: hypothetical protein Q7T82_18340 [Armatimonadota bacterium]|nr:hypothetical protein [Armatimonadota bacterium]
MANAAAQDVRLVLGRVCDSYTFTLAARRVLVGAQALPAPAGEQGQAAELLPAGSPAAT